MILAPGAILQKIHFAKSIQAKKPGFFIEVGPGNGVLSQILLKNKWKGIGFELDKNTAEMLKNNFKKFKKKGQYKVVTSDFLKSKVRKKADLILASMVIEHLETKKETEFFKISKEILKKTGSLFCYVPGSPEHWGIEDEVAGHFRRYTFKGVTRKLLKYGFMPKKIEGLTFPLSNLLLPLSNLIVKRYETEKLKYSACKKTKLSGRRKVPFKTEFPCFLKIILNPFAIYPFYLLQRIFKTHSKSLTIFFEAIPAR